MNVIISSLHDSGAGIRVFQLQAPAGQSLPSYEAGAHIDVTLGNGLVRQYSLCCRQPSSQAYRIAVKQEPQSRGGSAWLHTQARLGDSLTISAPRQAFALAEQADHHVLFAGGIGITPILSMAYALLRRGEDFSLHYFVRDAAALAFSEEMKDPALAAHVRVQAGLNPLQTAAAINDALDIASGNVHVYTCGPASFMAAVAELGTARHGPAAVHFESFSAPLAVAGDQAFVLRLKDGREITVDADKTALACLQEAGVKLDCSCEVGVCGTCQTTVIEGFPDHRDSYLSATEKSANRCFMPCVSRARSSVLVIDL
jgi:vanillate O-demethylase ferredoxin subunit